MNSSRYPVFASVLAWATSGEVRTGWSISFALASAILCGCASEPSLPPIRGGESINISVVARPQANGGVQIHNEAVGSGAAKGAGSGAVVGGLWGLACGPFAPLCIPMGAGLGAVTGTAAGATAGLTGALSDEKAAKLRERVVRIRESHDLRAELQKNITDRAQRVWNLDSDLAPTVVTVELQDLEFTSTRDESVRCVVTALVAVSGANELSGS